jgi:RHS repeat-associated protein
MIVAPVLVLAILTVAPGIASAAPTATTEAATEVTANSATLSATVNPNGLSTDYWFEYWPNGAYPLPSGGAALWFEADEIEGEDGSKVASWPDRSGNERDATQAEEAKQPELKTGELNGKPVVRFDKEAESYLRASGFTLNQPNTIFVVGSTSTYNEYFIDGGSDYNKRHFISRRWPNQWGMFGGAVLESEEGSGDSDPHLFTAVFDEEDSELRIDGEGAASGNGGSYPLKDATLGANHALTSFMDGDIAAVLVFDHRLPDAQTEDVEAYLQDKYFGAGTGTLELPSYAPASKEGDAGEGAEAVGVSEPVEGLASGTSYRYRAVASNAEGTSYGEDEAFTTGAGPTATTEAATEVTANSATLSATVNPNGLSTDYWFEYWPNGAYPLPSGGAALWFEADEIEGEDGSKVASWPDRSGNERDATQAEEAKQPELKTGELNGKPVVRFDKEAESYLRASGFTLNQPNTIFVVGSTSTYNEYFIDGGSDYNKRHFISRRWPNQWGMFGGAVLESEEGSGDSDPHLFTAVFDEEDSELRIDGEGAASGNGGSYPLKDATLGANHALTSFMDGDIAAVLVFDHRLPDAQTEDVEAYLQDKYFGAGTGTLELPSYAPASKEGDAGEGAEAVGVSEAVEGLEPSTSYHFRAVASNEDGVAFGKDEDVTTWGEVPAGSPPPGAFNFIHDSDGRLKAAIQPEGDIATYGWDAAGNLVAIDRSSSSELSIIQLSPASGEVGETIEIEGTGFSAKSNTVKFNGTAATVVEARPTTLVVEVPAEATSGSVTVETPTEGPASSPEEFTVADSSGPSIFSLSSALAAPEEEVTIFGAHFDPSSAGNIVSFNRYRPELVAAAEEALKFEVPSARLGGPVSVSTSQGSSEDVDLFVPPPGTETSEVGTTERLAPGAPETVALAGSEKVALLLFDATAGQRASIVLSESTIASGSVSIWSPGGDQIAAGSFSETEGGLIETEGLPATGTYTALLSPAGAGSGSVKVAAHAFAEPIGAIAPPASPEGTTEPVSITAPAQNARFKVPLSDGAKVALRTNNSEMSGQYKIKWTTPDGLSTVSTTFDPEENWFWDTRTFSPGGDWTLTVDPVGTATGTVDLQLWEAPDKTGATISEGGDSVTSTIEIPGQRELVSFAGEKDELISGVTSESTIAAGVEVTLLAPDGSTLSGGYPEQATLPETGTYTFVVDPKPTGTKPVTNGTGSVKLTAEQVPADQTGTITPAATPEGTTQEVSLTVPGQNASFKVPLSASAKVALRTNNANMGAPYKLKWTSPNGLTSFSTTLGAKTNWFWDTKTFSAEGEWTLLVDPEGSATGTVDLQLWEAPDITGATITPSAGGDSVTSTIEIPGQRELVTFEGSASQLVTVKGDESTIASGKLWVLKPDGNKLAGSEDTFSTSSYAHAEVTLPSTGTYTVVVDPPGTGTEAVANGTGEVEVTVYLGSHVAWPAPTMPELQLVSLASAGGPSGDSPALSYSDVPRGASEPAKGRVNPKPTQSRPLRRWRPPNRGSWFPPNAKGKRNWLVGRSSSPWLKAAPLKAPAGTTALAGQALKVDGLPIRGLEVGIEGTSVATRTDRAGRFLLERVPAGHQVLHIDGGMDPGGRDVGAYEIGVDLAAERTTVLDYTIWLTPLDDAGDLRVESPTKREVSLTTPRVPGLEVKLPAGTQIADADGRAVEELNMTAIPLDRAPFPLPPFVTVPIYFTVQPGGATLNKGARFVYPNWGELAPGERVDFWTYDPEDRGWHVYGRGTVTPDGEQVMPDPGVLVWELTGTMITSSPTPPEEWATGASGGDPVDLYSGLFGYGKTDLTLPDTIPISIERNYRPADANSYAFGIGTTNLYDLRLWSTNNYKEVDLILPDGGRIHYVRISPGEGWTNAVYRSTDEPGVFFGSTISWNQSAPGWDLELANGLTYVFGDNAPLQAIHDRHGNTLTIKRASGQTGNITQITSPNGRWAKFTYDGSNRITKVIDNGGREVKYTYTSGRLTKVEAPEGRTTEYEYESGRMTAITNARGNKYLENEYDANGRVKKQITADGGTFEFAYQLGEEGEVEATTITDPIGNQREVQFDAEGFPIAETEAPGTELAQTTTFERQPETGLILSETDPLERKTEFEYDSVGNVTEVTRLAGTEDAVTTELAYEPGTSLPTKITDPLGHETSFEYGPDGELLKRTDALENETTIEYDDEGLPVSITNPEEEETTLAYQHGDLAVITDPLGHTTTQFTDGLGRVRSVTAPGGQRTLFSYNDADELTQVTSPSGAETSIGYDKDGNVISLTDPRENTTTMAYDVMDRLEAETNPLEDTAERSYDKAGHLIEAVSRRGKVSKFSYDALGRLAKASFGVEGESAESTIEYEYDAADRLVGVDDSAGGEYMLGYDELDRLTEVSGPNGTVAYLYDDAGRRAYMSLPGQEPLEYTYDDANRLTGLSRPGEAVSLSYDGADRLTALTLPDGIEQLYGRDEAGQTTSITYKDGESTLGDLHYAYDANGRTKALWGSYARLTLPEALGSPKYNAANQLTERGEEELSYDKDGNLVEDGANEYEWDARGQLSGISGAAEASFSYDPFGRRISKTIGEATTGYLHDGANVAQEYEGEELAATVLTGLQMDQLFARTASKGAESYLTDRLGSVIALADSSKKTTTSYTYEPFGASTIEGESDNPFQFTGRENDGTGLQYNRARYYDPGSARFLSPDPAGFEGSGSNLYNYVGGDPLNLIDPTGEISWPVHFDPFDPFEDAIDATVNKIGDWVSDAPAVLSAAGSWLVDNAGALAVGCIGGAAGGAGLLILYSGGAVAIPYVGQVTLVGAALGGCVIGATTTVTIGANPVRTR